MATPRYSSIFNFLQSPQMQSGGGGTVTPGFLSAYGDPGSWAYTPSMYGRGDEGWQYTAPDIYKDILSVSYDPGAGEDPKGGYVSSIDWSKLPNQGNTGLGHVSTLMPIDGPNFRKLKDPSLVTYDENYGWVTPQSNYKESFMEKASPYLAMAGGTALFGGAALGAAGLGAEAGGLAAEQAGLEAWLGADALTADAIAAYGGGAGGAGISSSALLGDMEQVLAGQTAAGGGVTNPAWLAPGLPQSLEKSLYLEQLASGNGLPLMNTAEASLLSIPAIEGGSGLLPFLDKVGSGLAKAAPLLSLAKSTGLLDSGGGGGGGISLGGGGGRGFGGNPGIIPGQEDDATKMAELLRKQKGLGQYLYGGLLGGQNG